MNAFRSDNEDSEDENPEKKKMQAMLSGLIFQHLKVVRLLKPFSVYIFIRGHRGGEAEHHVGRRCGVGRRKGSSEGSRHSAYQVPAFVHRLFS